MIDPNNRRAEQQKHNKKQADKKNAPPRAKQLKKAKKGAKKSFAPTPVGKAVNQCPAAQKMSSSAAQITSAPKPVSENRQKCSLIRTDLFCEHSERRSKDGLLEVVPTRAFFNPSSESSTGIKKVKSGVTQGSSDKGDKLTLKATMHQNCGSHPIWKIKDDKNNLVKQQTGESVSFEVLPPAITSRDVPNFLTVWWLKNIQPKKYKIECIDHNGSTSQNNVSVYPLIESSITFDFLSSDKNAENSFLKKLRVLALVLQLTTGVFDKVVPNVKEFKVKMLAGSLTLKNAWAEDSKTHRAYWEGELSIGFSPIISIMGKCAITPSFIPSFVSKYADVYAYISLKGEITAKSSLKWKGSDIHYDQGGSTLTGSVTGTVGVESYAKVGKYTVISIDVNGGTKLSAEAKLTRTIEPQISLDGKIKWDPLTVKFSVEVLDGWISKGGSYSFFEQKTIFSASHKFLEAEKSSGGGSGGGGGGAH